MPSATGDSRSRPDEPPRRRSPSVLRASDGEKKKERGRRERAQRDPHVSDPRPGPASADWIKWRRRLVSTFSFPESVFSLCSAKIRFPFLKAYFLSVAASNTFSLGEGVFPQSALSVFLAEGLFVMISL